MLRVGQKRDDTPRGTRSFRGLIPERPPLLKSSGTHWTRNFGLVTGEAEWRRFTGLFLGSGCRIGLPVFAHDIGANVAAGREAKLQNLVGPRTSHVNGRLRHVEGVRTVAGRAGETN